MIFIDNQKYDAAQLKYRGAQLASLLQDKGCQQDDIYAILLKNCSVFLECIVASRFSGVYYCPLNWHFKGGQLPRPKGTELVKASWVDQG